ncbi:abasic site processing protein HMCES [Calliphora vicina]|uniref:abasic site processing protein HMCES n=1 Tax=Calliphora vicina TaxID=7373 RepID=UPI00325A97FD
MCGRTCLTLEPSEITKACRYKYRHDKNIKTPKDNNETKKDTSVKEEQDKLEPEYRLEFNCGRKYCPSYNVAPTDITPVLVSTAHFCDEEDSKNQKNTRIVVPMMWGMIPFWHRGDWRKHGLTTNNCRLEHMLESKLYRGPFRRGQRCVILCEGFYEWQTTKSSKPSERAAHLLYMPQKDEIKIYDRNTWQAENINLLKMAGLFDIWEDEHGDKIYSYAVITFESSKIMSWMHHRMPAILETEEQVNNWLDFKNVSDEQALATLRPATQLQWHRVSNIVNNSRNKTDQCNKPFEMVKAEKPAMNKMMSSWLNVRKRKEAALAQSGSDLDDEELQNYLSGGTGTTSESESELSSASKRPRFRDFKRDLRNLQNTEDQEGLTYDGESDNETKNQS